jgi:excisionase family DNA binding protein
MAKKNKATVSISEAARLTNKTRATIYRHIKSGKLSVTKQGDGTNTVSIPELERVYGFSVSGDTGEQASTVTTNRINDTSHYEGEISRLNTNIDQLKSQVEDLKRDKEWLQKLISDLTIKRLPSPMKSVWSKFFGLDKRDN